MVLDVGQGDATLIRSPGGRWILVDTGPRTQSFDAGERRILPYLEQRGVESLEVLILTHPDMDHVGGAASLLARIPVGRVLGPGVPAGTGVFVDALESAQDAGVPWSSIQAGDSLNLDGMALRVLAPERGREDRESGDPNALSVVLELRFGAFYALLTGDAPAASEREFLPRILSTRITALKVGHHGSATSTSPALVLKTRPELALVSVGRRNRFGHPAPDVVGRLRKVGARVIRTDLNGNLVLRVGEDGTVRTLLQHPQDPDAGDLLRR